MSKRRHSDDDKEDDTEGSEQEFQVEVITQVRVNKQRKHEYLVKWAGYGSEDDSWEPFEHVKECNRLLEGLWDDIGVEKRLITEPGRVFHPSKEWLAKERNYFRGIDLDEEEEGKGREERPKSNTKKKSPKTAKHRKVVSLSSSDGDAPLSRKKHRTSASKTSKPSINSLQPENDERGSEDSDLAKKKKQRTEQPDSQIQTDPPSLIDTAESKINSSSGGTSRTPLHRSEPKIKTISMPLTGHAKGISAKERIIQQMTASGDQPPLPIPPRKLSKLSFKKNKGADIVTQDPLSVPTPVGKTVTSATIDRPPLRTELSTAEVGSGWDNFSQAPQDLSNDNSPRPVDDDAVINFLASIAPESDVVSQREEAMRTPKERDLQTSGLHQNPSSWSWTGELYIGVGLNTLENLCEVSITGASVTPPRGVSLQLLDSRKSIQLKRHYKIPEIKRILPALEKPVQFARIKPGSTNDKTNFGFLMKFIRDNDLIIRASITNDSSNLGNHPQSIAELFIFSQSLDSLSIFRIPDAYRQANEDSLVIVLFPGILPNQSKLWLPRKVEIGRTIQEKTDGSSQDSKPRSSSIDYRLARVQLSVPDKLLEPMSRRMYTIWPEWQRDDLPLSRRARDSIALRQMLMDSGAKDADLSRGELKVIFIHVTGLLNINKFRNVARTRREKPGIHFFKFGTHERVSRQSWDVREIFPLGGVVTFMPHMLIEDPYRLKAICMKIRMHKRWMCYVIPSSLGYFIKMMTGDNDPLLTYDRDPEIFSSLLQLIEEGILSVFNSPRLNDRMNGNFDQWCAAQIFQSSLQSQRELLRNCLDAYASDYDGVPPADIFRKMEDLVSQDLYSLQVQPGIVDTYRRFVAIKSSRDQQISELHNCIEWANLQEFSFGDDYLSDVQDNPSDLLL